MRHIPKPRFRSVFSTLGLVAFAFSSIACAAEQGPECKAFVVCVSEFDTLRQTETNVDRFLPEGACWGGEKGAAVCEAACRRGIVLLHQQEAALTCKTARGGAL